MKVAICYLTNTKKDQAVSEGIKESLENVVVNNPNNVHTYDLYTLINVDKPKKKDNKNTYSFTWDELREKYNHVNRVFYRDYMGVCHLPLFYLQEKQPDYDYYIFYEDDLYFTGFNFNVNPFEGYIMNDYDVAFTYGRSYNPEWFWVSKFEYSLPEGWVGFEGLLNCYVISNQALKDLKEFCCNGKWHGHHELMVNSFFENQKDKYRTTSLNRIYKSRIFLDVNDLILYLMKQEDIGNTFIHPIKTFDMLMNIKSAHPENN